MYSPDQWEILAEVNSVICITAVSLIFGRKLASFEGPVSYIRGLLLILYGLTWAFNLISCMLTSTNNGNFISCAMTQFNVALIATAAKIALYLYFTEKVYIISMPTIARLKTISYRVHLGLILPSAGIMILQIFFRIDVVAVDFPFHCTVGLELPASLISLAYDVVINLMFSCYFLKYYCFPTTAQQADTQSASLNIMAKSNFITTILSVITLSVNYIILICFSGERGLIASSSYSLALTIICSAIHWVTSHPAESQLNESALRNTNNTKSKQCVIQQFQVVFVDSTDSNKV